MSLKDFIKPDIIAKAKEKSSSMGDIAQTRVMEWLDEYKKAADTLETLGFTVGKFSFGMGVLPEIHTSLNGRLEDIHADALEQMMETRADDKLLCGLLKALLMTRQFADRVEIKLKQVTLNITLGLPPSINVEVH
jgi:hypothetical protein